MSAPAAVAILGGSSAFTPALAAALADSAHALPPLEVRLQGRDPGRAALVANFCGRLARARGAPHRYVGSASVAEAASGVRIVIHQIRAGGFAARLVDETFPLRFGIPGDETIGPGGLASAIRTVPVAMRSVREAVAAAPDAWIVNLTNPMSIVLGAITKIPGARAFGLCELPGRTVARAAALAGIDASELDFDYVGVNHQGYILGVSHRGRDLLPTIADAIEASDDGFFGFSSRELREAGAIPLRYLRLLARPAAEAAGQRARPRPRAAELEDLSRRLYATYRGEGAAELPPDLAEREMPWLREAIVPAIEQLLGSRRGARTPEFYVSEPNDGHVPELPAGAILEKRCQVSEEGPRAVPFRGEPASRARYMGVLRELVEYESLAVRAALDPTRASVEAALRAHPLTRGGPVGELADAVLEAADAPAPAGRAGGVLR